MVPRVTINRITFSDGTDVSIAQDDVVVVVGPNNSGKTAALRGIRDKLSNESNWNPVIQAVQIQRTGTADDVINGLSGWAVQNAALSPGNTLHVALGNQAYDSDIRASWQRGTGFHGALARWFCHLLTADERLQICNPPDNIALTRDGPTHPIHFLQRDDKLELRLSAKFRKAFGVDLVVNRNAGRVVPLHVGVRPTPSAGEDRVSISYIERLEKLEHLQFQGDGMRSFAGVLLATSVGRESILLIDEPEAFLHPPQARLLGTTLVQDRRKERQLFIATHSTDVLRGVLDTESPDIRVIRICRSGSMNSIRLLNNDRIKELWSDPLLRYSNILDGLFHESVVVCEADADCRFYSAILDAVVAGRPDGTRRPDLMFTHCGGKARLPVVIRALREVDVPVKAVADFDVLSDEEPLRSIVEALGMQWSNIRGDWNQVKSGVDGKKPDLNTDEVKKEIQEVLTGILTPTFPQKAKADIQTILRKSSPWAHAKRGGKSFVPSGDAHRACERLLAALRAGGLYVVEVGELEGFARTESGHGPKWVNAVLTRSLATDRELEPARQFVLGLMPS